MNGTILRTELNNTINKIELKHDFSNSSAWKLERLCNYCKNKMFRQSTDNRITETQRRVAIEHKSSEQRSRRMIKKMSAVEIGSSRIGAIVEKNERKKTSRTRKWRGKKTSEWISNQCIFYFYFLDFSFLFFFLSLGTIDRLERSCVHEQRNWVIRGICVIKKNQCKSSVWRWVRLQAVSVRKFYSWKFMLYCFFDTLKRNKLTATRQSVKKITTICFI